MLCFLYINNEKTIIIPMTTIILNKRAFSNILPAATPAIIHKSVITTLQKGENSFRSRNVEQNSWAKITTTIVLIIS
jgi:hypothetical protein